MQIVIVKDVIVDVTESRGVSTHACCDLSVTAHSNALRDDVTSCSSIPHQCSNSNNNTDVIITPAYKSSHLSFI